MEHLAQKRRLQTLVSRISVIAVWLYSEPQFLAHYADAGAEDDMVGLHSWLTFGGCFAWLLAAAVTARPKPKFCTFNHEWIWVPLASFCCALVVQPRPYEVAFAVKSSLRCHGAFLSGLVETPNQWEWKVRCQIIEFRAVDDHQLHELRLFGTSFSTPTDWEFRIVLRGKRQVSHCSPRLPPFASAVSTLSLVALMQL